MQIYSFLAKERKNIIEKKLVFLLFAISKKLGLSDNIINDASRRLDSEDIKFEDLVTDLEQSRVTIEREREELNEYKAQIAQLKSELTKKTERLDERTDNIIRKANEEAARILKDAKEYADKTINAMNKHGMTVKELEKHAVLSVRK